MAELMTQREFIQFVSEVSTTEYAASEQLAGLRNTARRLLAATPTATCNECGNPPALHRSHCPTSTATTEGECYTCKGDGEIVEVSHETNSADVVPCPDCATATTEGACPEDCIQRAGRSCLLSTNHCTRRAEDFYTPTGESD